MEEANYTTVQSVLDGDIVFVGEEHGNKKCADLAERIVSQVQPETLAVELPPHRTPNSTAGGGMAYICQHAKENRLPIVLIDKHREDLWDVADSYPALSKVANTFSYPIEDNGDLNPQAITDARSNVRDRFGQEAYNQMYTVREEHMVRNLLAVRDAFPTPIVAGVGTFHIFALRDMFNCIDEPNPLSDERVYFDDETDEAEATPA